MEIRPCALRRIGKVLDVAMVMEIEKNDHGLPYEETVYGVTCRDEFRKLSMYVRHRRVEHLTAIFKIP